MKETIVIQTLDQLRKYLNDKGILEIVIRGEKKRFKCFQKIALDKLTESDVSEKLQQAVKSLSKYSHIADKKMKMLGSIKKLEKLDLVLSGINLCATCAGFAIMYAKLDKMSAQIAEMVAIYKKSAAISTTYELNKIISEHSNMLDCRKKKSYYTEEQMRKLVDDEFNCLDLLMNVFSSGISSNREEIVFSILSLAQMLSVSLRYFDEIYYFDNKEAIGNGDLWHISHVKWVGIYDKLSSGDFIEQLQDFGMFEMNLSTVETDCFCVSFYDQIRSLKQDIEDNQSMIVAVDDKELFRSIVRQTNEEARREIESALREADVPLDQCKEFVQVAVGA